MNRRDFVLRTGAAAAAVGIARGALALAPAGPDAVARPLGLSCRILFDRRFESCRSFAAGAASLGCPVQSLAGDITSLWFHELQPSWARGERAVVGMTTGATFFCLEQLARDHWMRVTALIEHRSGPGGSFNHRLSLQEPTLQEATAAIGADSRWPERLAGPLLKGLSVDARGSRTERTIVTRSLLERAPSVPLVSWAITARGCSPATA